MTQPNRNTELILHQIRDYLEARGQAATRINPKLAPLLEDIFWQQINQLRLILNSGRGFGPVKYLVADLLVSDDIQKVRALFSPTDQVSILTEVVQGQEEKKGQKTAGQLEVHDMPSMFKTLDPSLEKIITLIQSWIWWDLEDACDLVKFDQTLQRIQLVDHSGVPPQLAQYYADQFRVAPQQMTPDVVVAHELGRAEDLIQRFAQRRAEEEGYKNIVKREEMKDASPEALIRAIARQYSMLDAIHEGKPLDEATKSAYARALNLPPEQVTPDRVAQALTRAIEEGKSRLRAALTGQTGGRPFNYKEAQLEQIRQRFEQARRGRQPHKLTAPKPDGGAAQTR